MTPKSKLAVAFLTINSNSAADLRGNLSPQSGATSAEEAAAACLAALAGVAGAECQLPLEACGPLAPVFAYTCQREREALGPEAAGARVCTLAATGSHPHCSAGRSAPAAAWRQSVCRLRRAGGAMTAMLCTGWAEHSWDSATVAAAYAAGGRLCKMRSKQRYKCTARCIAFAHCLSASLPF